MNGIQSCVFHLGAAIASTHTHTPRVQGPFCLSNQKNRNFAPLTCFFEDVYLFRYFIFSCLTISPKS